MQNNNNDIKAQVLVTGANSFLGAFIVKLLLEKDYKVRGSVYSLANKPSYQFLYDLIPEKSSNLELVEADLTNKEVWASVTKGVEYIFHVASPTPNNAHKDEDYYIKPAVAGVMNVLEAALENGVKKVVVTSSVSAVAFRSKDKIFTEDDWEDEEGLIPYPKSKVRAERAAWAFYEKNKDKIQVSVVNPSFVFGPVMNDKGNTSGFVGIIMEGALPGVFETAIPVVDVRDVAEVHFRAMFREEANGRRYLCVAESVGLADIARWLNKEFASKGVKVSEEKVSLEEVMKNGSEGAKTIGGIFGSPLTYDNQRSVKELGMQYISVEKTIVDTGYSLIEHGIVNI